MSHFCVMVIGPDVSRQLATYDENLKMDPYKEYVPPDPTEWPRSFYAKPENGGVDPLDDEAVARASQEKWGEEDPAEVYQVDAGGLFQWSTRNPQGYWDYWRIGGRFARRLLVVPGAEGYSEPLSWEWQTHGDDPPPPGVDSCKRMDLDLAGMRLVALEKATAEWKTYIDIINTYGPLPSSEWRENHTAPDFDIYRKAYWAHPTVKALRETQIIGLLEGPWERFEGKDEEAFLAEAIKCSMPGYAMVAEGSWMAPGKMGWFGCSSETPDDLMAFKTKQWEIVESLGPDVLITLVDCHI